MIIGLPAYLVETASLEKFMFGQEPNCAYDNWVSHIAEGVALQNYNLYAPYDRQTQGFGDYQTPTSTKLNQWSNIVDLFLLGELSNAQAAVDAAGFPYQVVHFNDVDSRRTYYMLREVPNAAYYDDNGTADPYDDESGAFAYGWGLYIYSPQASRPIILTAPHPTDDFITPVMTYDAFRTWDASYMLISGCGREVKWTNIGNYTNSKSLTDPSRNEAHPFNICYQKFADKIRTETGKREFSYQVHSYDWNRHEGYANVQVSAGNNKLCPNLPIRDLSSLKQDLIHRGSHLMIPANRIGTHEDVFLNQYYAVNYSIHDFIFDDGVVQYPVNNNIDLPAYAQNRQMLHTLNGWNDYDSFEPFMHIEMDELPNEYEETENNYKWFYGWNEAEGKWDFNNLFTNTRRYYSRWVQDLNSLFDDLFVMDDGLTPPTPENLRVVNSSMYYATLAWDRSDAYDFDSYEILYATSPITETNFQVFDRNNNPFLASQACESINVTGLSNTGNYYFQIRAKDKNDNFSPLSNEVTTAPAPANVTNFTAHGMEGKIRVYWTVSGQSGLQGFEILRKSGNGVYIQIASYTDNSMLLVGSSSYEYWDLDVEAGIHYTYTLNMVNATNYEFVHNVPQTASLGAMHNLIFSTVSGSNTDTLTLGSNPYASDGQDAYWDVSKGSPGSNYVWIASWQPYWGNYGTSLSREMRAGYDLNNDIKDWTLRVRSDKLNTPLQIAVEQPVQRAEKLYLYDSATGSWHDLYSGPYQFTVSNTNVRTMTLHWGNLQPLALHGYMANQIYQGGASINMTWNLQNSFLIDHFDLYIKNASDSLMVLDNSPATVNSYNFTLPQAIDMPKAKIYIDLVAIDGVIRTFSSPHTLAFVPKMNLFYSEPGWITKSNPFTQTAFSFPDIFGEGATGYIWNNEWEASLDYGYNTAYFVNATDYLFSSTTSDVQSTESNVNLSPGWNFVPNPHLCAYEISALRFVVNGNLFRYSEMIDQQLISRAIYVYRDHSYQMVESIQPYEAFFIRSYANSDMSVQLSFYPYYSAPQIMPPAPNWSVKVTASAADTDSFRFGASPIAANGLDFRMDMPKAPAKSLFPSILSYLPNPEGEGLPALQEEFRANFPGAAEQDMIFDFAIDVADSSPVEFRFDPVDIPSHWTLRFVMHNVPMTISADAVYEFLPAEAGTYTGYVRVSNHPVSNTDLVQSPITQVQVFPNPFNPNTTIRFHNPQTQDVKVNIYNLRGQKVCELQRGSLASGMQSLQWQGRDDKGRPVASGIYFAKIESKKSSQSIKMILMK